MKRFISALLVVMMLVSMLPANVFAAAETFSYDFSTFSGTSTQNAEETHALSSDVTLYIKGCHINTQLRVYGSQDGQFAIFKADSKPISAITVNAGYKADTLVVSGSNDDGASWTDLATQDVTSTYTDYTFTFAEQYKWVKLNVTGTAQVRIKTVSLTLNPAEGACTHEGYETYEGDDAVAATCTSEGKTATVYCANCNGVVEIQATVAKLPHSIVNGVCESCQGVAYELVTDISKLHTGSQIVIVATENAVTMGTAADKNNRPEVALDKSEDGSIVIFGEDAQVLTIEAGTEVGTYAFNVGSGYLYAAGGTSSNYLKTKAELDALGSWTIEIDEAGIATIKAADTATTKNWIRYNDSGKIFSCYADGQKNVAIYILPVAEDPDAECDHLGYETYEGDDYVAPTCTTTGSTATVYCANCDAVVKEPEVLPVSHEGFETYTEGAVEPDCETEGATGTTYCSNCDEVVAESEVIPATGHDYVDGTCTVCGQADPNYSPDAPAVTGYVQVTDVADITAGGEFVIVANNGGTYQALSTSIGNKINPTTVTVANGVVTTENPPVWEIAAFSNGISLYSGSNYLTYVSSTNLGSAASPYAWTVEVASEGTFYITSAANTGRGLIYQAGTGNRYGGYAISNRAAAGYVGALQLYKLVEEEVDPNACTHELTEVTAGYPATCTADGKEDTLSCKCGQNVQEGAVIPSPGHSYDDDYCAACNSINPEAAKQAEAIDGLPAAGDQVIFYYHSSKVAMGTAPNNDRMSAVNVTKANGKIPYSETATAVMTVEQVGEYFRFRMGDQYLTTGATGSTLCFAALPAEGETDLTLWKITPAATYTWGVNICSVYATYNGTDYNQTIEYYNSQFYPFGFDGTSYAYSYQIQIGLVNKITLTADVDGLTYEGKLNLDLNGYKATNVVADELVVWDSSATSTTAGTGSLTTECAVAVDNTVDGVRYIALKGDDGAYTFHVLDLKLSNVTLRTNKAGIYYKGEMACDEVLAAQIDCHGIAVSIVGMPTADFANEANTAATKIYGAPEGVFTSGSVTNIFREDLSAEKNAARGEMAIYGNAYIQLYDGTVLMGSNQTQKSLKDIMDYLNTNYASLEAEDQANALAFYETWADAMANWELTNLADALSPVTPSEPETEA